MKETIQKSIKNAFESLLELGEDTGREEILDAIPTILDCVWSYLVQRGPICEYTIDDLIETLPACAEIIKYADDYAWVEDDAGLWEGLDYGLVPAIAYHSLQNCLYQAFEDAGYNLNSDYPLKGN